MDFAGNFLLFVILCIPYFTGARNVRLLNPKTIYNQRIIDVQPVRAIFMFMAVYFRTLK